METAYVTELENKRSAIAFKNRRIEAEYRAYVSRRSELNVRRQLALAAVILVGATLLDLAFLPRDLASRALAARVFLALLPIAVAFSLTYHSRRLWARQLAGAVVALGVGLTSLTIGDTSDVRGYPGFAGGFIVIVFAYFFLGLYYINAVWVGIALIVAYAAIAMRTGVQPTSMLYTTYNLVVLNVVCAFGAGQLELARRRDFLKERMLSYHATSDQLSGLGNRRAFDAHLAAAWDHARQTNGSLALFLIDIDHFKAFNDHYGHQAGDEAIRRVGQAIRRVLRRPEDFASRYGGEEFAAIVPKATEASATLLAERIREEVLREAIPHAHSSAGDRVSVSIGVAHLYPQRAHRTSKGFLQIADEALYTAKERGRNRVVSATALTAEETGMFGTRARSTAPASGSSAR